MENNRTSIQPSRLRTNEYYVVYYNFAFKTLITELFPYCSLIFLNLCIYREIRRSIKLQQSMRCTHPQKEEIKSANVVVGYFFIFVFARPTHKWCIYPWFLSFNKKFLFLINFLQPILSFSLITIQALFRRD